MTSAFEAFIYEIKDNIYNKMANETSFSFDFSRDNKQNT
jgi:hypothetical protein